MHVLHRLIPASMRFAPIAAVKHVGMHAHTNTTPFKQSYYCQSSSCSMVVCRLSLICCVGACMRNCAVAVHFVHTCCACRCRLQHVHSSLMFNRSMQSMSSNANIFLQCQPRLHLQPNLVRIEPFGANTYLDRAALVLPG